MKLSPYHVKPDRTTWTDATGRTLADVLALAEREHATRVMLTGPSLPREWLLQLVPGWTHGRHYLDHDVPTGRYTHERAGVTVEVRRAAEWFGGGDYTPREAEAAWEALGRILAAQRGGGVLLRSPGATGHDLWLRAAGGEVPDPLPDDVQELMRQTPQHRIELRPPAVPDAPALWVLDGRWMYAALTRELGSGPVSWLRGEDAAAHFARDPHARARYLVRFAAPAWWRETPHAIGVLMARGTDGWETPLSGETWADAAEVHLAVEAGWSVQFLEGVAFTPGRPLDAWTARLVRARERVSDDELGPRVAELVRRAVRAILLHAIGSWHSSGRDETTVTASPMQPPAGDGWEAPERLDNGAVLWRRRRGLPSGRAAAMRHPEWSAQVWGRAHARILSSPTGTRGVVGGLLATMWADVVAVYGDALMTTRRPLWADHDDGRPGRLRVKGHLCGPLAWPTTAGERDRLTRAASAAGPTCERGCR